MNPAERRDPTEVYTDGSCLGNPGPGGWAFVVDGGPWAYGHASRTTNQRMEVDAAARAVEALEGPIRVVSDSTYVVKCFNDEWWKGWHRRNWLNAAKKPVANRDLWEPFIDAVLARGDVEFAWVKGHSGQRLNSAADVLAVHAASTGQTRSGERFGDHVLDDLADSSTQAAAGEPAVGSRPDEAARTSEVDGHVVGVLGHRPPELGGYGDNPTSRKVLRQLGDVLIAKQQMHPDLVVATGLGQGAETIGAEAALAGGVRYIVVLAFEGIEERWPGPSRRRFAELRQAAAEVKVLSSRRPADSEAFGRLMRRRDTWLVRNSDEAILVRRSDDRTLAEVHRRLEDALDDVWVIQPD